MTEHENMKWFDIAVTPGGCFVIDCDDGFQEFLNGTYWEDNFQSDPPVHLERGSYRWNGFKVGYWGEDEGMNIIGGDFMPAHFLGWGAPAEEIGILANRIVGLAPRAGLHVGITIKPAEVAA